MSVAPTQATSMSAETVEAVCDLEEGLFPVECEKALRHLVMLVERDDEEDAGSDVDDDTPEQAAVRAQKQAAREQAFEAKRQAVGQLRRSEWFDTAAATATDKEQLEAAVARAEANRSKGEAEKTSFDDHAACPPYVASLFVLRFFERLPEPLVPAGLHEKLVYFQSNRTPSFLPDVSLQFQHNCKDARAHLVKRLATFLKAFVLQDVPEAPLALAALSTRFAPAVFYATGAAAAAQDTVQQGNVVHLAGVLETLAEYANELFAYLHGEEDAIHQHAEWEKQAQQWAAYQKQQEEYWAWMNRRVSTSVWQVGVSEEQNPRHRKKMEDAHTLMPTWGRHGLHAFFGVFDGHGGKFTADQCAAGVHKALEQVGGGAGGAEVGTVETWQTRFQQAFKAFDLELCATLRAKKDGSGSTAAVAVVESVIDPADEAAAAELAKAAADNYSDHLGPTPGKAVVAPVSATKRMLHCANLGDARVTVCKDGQAVRMTHDHKSSDPEEIARIQAQGGLVFGGKVAGVLAVARAFGDVDMKTIGQLAPGAALPATDDGGGWVSYVPFCKSIEIDASVTFMIIACDGLWDVCSDEEAVQIVSEAPDPQTASAQLVQYALDKKSTDNISVVVVRF